MWRPLSLWGACIGLLFIFSLLPHWSTPAVAQNNQGDCIERPPRNDGVFGAKLEDDGRTWQLFRNDRIYGKVRLHCQFIPPGPQTIGMALGEIMSRFCVGGQVSLFDYKPVCQIERVILPTHFPGFDQFSDAQTTTTVLWTVVYFFAGLLAALYRRALSLVSLWSNTFNIVVAPLAGVALMVGLIISPGYPIFIFPAGLALGVSLGSIIGLGLAVSLVEVGPDDDPTNLPLTQLKAIITIVGVLLIILSAVFAAGIILMLLPTVTQAGGALKSDVAALVVGIPLFVIWCLSGLAVVFRWQSWKAYATVAGWLNVIVGGLGCLAYLLNGLTSGFTATGFASVLLVGGLVLLRAKEVGPPLFEPEDARHVPDGMVADDRPQYRAATFENRIDATEARFRSTYPFRQMFAYQAQGLICGWLIVGPPLFIWKLLHPSESILNRYFGWFLNSLFGTDLQLFLGYLGLTILWLTVAVAMRNYMRIAAWVLFLIGFLNGISILWAIQISNLATSAIAGFMGSGHPIFALGPAVLYIFVIAESFYVAFVCVRAGVALLTITPQQRRAIVEVPRVFSSRLISLLVRIVGFPISFYYARRPLLGFVFIICLSFLSSLLLSTVIIAVVVGLPSQTVDGLLAVWQRCGEQVECYDGVAFVALLFPVIGPAIFVLMLSGVGNGVLRLLRRLLRISLHRVQEIDHRAPAVFLRAFRDDQVLLRAPKLGLAGRLVDIGRSRTTLDEMFLQEATPYGPVVALGDPRDKSPPYGAARGYFDTGSWQEAVADIVARSTCVVLCIDDTEGIWWEVNHIVGNGYLGKTLFLIHPKFSSSTDNGALLSLLQSRLECNHESLNQFLAMPKLNESIIGFFVDRDGRVAYSLSTTFSRFAYLLAIRTFLRSLHG
jgi:hypothetical protein